MFVRYYLELPLPAGQVEQTLVRAPSGWLAAIAATAHERGHGLLSELGVEGPGARVGPGRGAGGPGGFRLGEPVHLASMTSLPLAWEPAGLLAGLDAILELGALGPARTQLAISARYQPPEATAGQPGNRFLAHRVAEATLKDFLDQLGHAISLSQPDPAGRIGP
jgi:hypothetical protein